MSNYSQESLDRLHKLEMLKEKGINPYPGKFSKEQDIKEIIDQSEKLTIRETNEVKADPQSKFKTAGRIMTFRKHGKLNFATLRDQTGTIQVCFMADVLPKEQMDLIDLIDTADFIGVTGELFMTNHGELTIMATNYQLLSKSIRPLPEKWHGIKDQETKYRKRYLDMLANQDSFDRFILRSKFIQLMRQFYLDNGFLELQTPVLSNQASGALAKPFTTHHNALDIDVYLRIATETYLKKAMVGGLERVFEIGPDFRNEGSDPSHLQEFYMSEHYAAYWDFADNMKFTEDMITYILKNLLGTLEVEIPDRDGNLHKVDFTAPWPRISIQDLVKQDCGIDINNYDNADDLRSEIEAKNIDLSEVDDYSSLGLGNLIDQLYKKVSRPKMIQPAFLINHPVELSPLARRNDDNPRITDRFQLVVNSWEVVNAYSELVDPIDQRKRLEEQASLRASGDTDAMMMDEPFIESMEHGMPPMSGWGMGIERMLALLTKQPNLRDVVLFPLLKPEHDNVMSASPGVKEPVVKPGFTREQAVSLVDKYVAADLQPHLYFVEQAMRSLANYYGHEDQAEVWGLAGLLHDVDWSITQDQIVQDPLAHCGVKLEEILGEINASPEFIEVIRSHYKEHGLPLDTDLKKALFAVDELCGLIVAATLVRPSKKMDDLKVKSVVKKFKDKSFAAKVDRSLITTCETNLKTPINDFIEITLSSMKEIAKEYGM